MNWTAAIDRQRASLLSVMAVLYAMLGVAQGGVIAVVTRGLRLKVLRQLRSAESAGRRMLILEALGISVPDSPPSDQSKQKSKSGSKSKTARKPSFPLIEPLQRTSPPKPPYAAGPGPRIFFFDGFDPPIESPPPARTADDPMDAARLLARLQALQDVLDNPQKYARRLARWSARHRSKRTKPLRPGRPPGHRSRWTYPVDEILAECHELALRALAYPDTS